VSKKEHSQHEVVELAQKYKDNPGVATLLSTLTEARCLAERHLSSASGYATATLEVLRNPAQAGRSIPYSSADTVTDAAKAASALDLYARTVINLACVLESLGEEVIY
jgi:hypothetical protein